MLAFIWAALNLLCVCVTTVCHIGTEFESSLFSRDYLKFGGECELFLKNTFAFGYYLEVQGQDSLL